jgi:hypothetical protein
MKPLLPILFFLIPLAFATNFTSVSFDSAVSVGGIYNFEAYTNETINYTQQCLATFKDKYGNVVNSLTADSNYNAIKVDRNGHVKSFVRIDDRFMVGENYTFYMNCGIYAAEQEIMIDVAGDIEINRLYANISGYSVSHPEQVLWAIPLGIIAFLIIIKVYGEVKNA